MNFLPNIKSTLIGLAALMIAPSIASADQFALMDRVEGGTGAEVTLGAIIIENADGLVLKNDYHFQLGLDALSVYAFVPTTHLVGDDMNTAMGNIEAGIVGKTEFAGLSMAYRFGVSAPTASGSADLFGMADLITNAYGAMADPSNITAGLHDVLGIRSSVSPEIDLGPVFVRADIGTDILIGMGDGADTAEVLLRVNAAAGFDLGMVQLAAESVNSFILTESDADPLSSVGVTAAFGIDAATVFAGVSVPLSSGLADVQGQPVVVSTGVRVGF